MDLRWLVVAVLPVCACAGRGQAAPPPPTFGSLARRCGMTVGALDSLLSRASAQARSRRIDIGPRAFGAILSTRLPDQSRPADCPAIADTIARTIMQTGG